MKTLILMRHAKSDWSRHGEPDRERSLNPRGRRAAALIGAWLADEGNVPGAALVSGAVRTRETWKRMRLECPDVRYDDTLYLCGPETIFEAVQAAPDCDRLLVLGHNPGMASAMAQFADTPKRFEVPTGATAIYALDVENWRDAVPGSGRLVSFEVPKTLV